MIDYLKFEKLDNIELIELTNNTIMLFNNREALFEARVEFEKLMQDDNYEFVSFSTNDNKKIVYIKQLVVCRDITGIYIVNDSEQQIIMTVEPISILALKSNHDLWLIDKNENNKWSCYPFTDFTNDKDGNKYTNNIQIYKFICESKYGCKL
jgi:hypothetical protein